MTLSTGSVDALLALRDFDQMSEAAMETIDY